MFLTDLFGKLKSLLSRAFGVARSAGLTDDLMDLALKYVRLAANKTIDNAAKREWVVEALRSRGVPGSIARIAVELAYQLYKREVAPVLGAPKLETK